MLLRLFFFLILLPLLDLFALLRLGMRMGPGALLLVLVTGFAGWKLIGKYSRSIREQMRGTLATGKPLGGTFLQKIGKVISGGLLLFPGVISDLMGILLLFPFAQGGFYRAITLFIQNWLVRQTQKGAPREERQRHDSNPNPPQPGEVEARWRVVKE